MNSPQVGDRISEYMLDAQVGAGSFGQVWKAHHHVWRDQIVAVKIPTDSQYVRTLQREGVTIHGLQHPNIVRAIGFDPYADVPYLVMEFVDGPSLRALIQAHPRGLPVAPAQRIATGILRALGAAHAAGVVHRDMKPENILIANGKPEHVEAINIGDVKVTDFGLGMAGAITTASIMQSGSLRSIEGKSISGTLAYMAPEQRDEGRTDARCDLYSVGIILFEMLCGERPSGSDMPSHVRDGLPNWVDAVFSRLYTRLERRYGTAQEVLDVIERTSAPPIQSLGVQSASSHPLSARDSRARRPASCPTCNARVEPGDNYCIMCGTQVVENPRRCPSCSGYPDDDDRFCIFCGTRLPAMVG